jgi:butyrate kinase
MTLALKFSPSIKQLVSEGEGFFFSVKLSHDTDSPRRAVSCEIFPLRNESMASGVVPKHAGVVEVFPLRDRAKVFNPIIHGIAIYVVDNEVIGDVAVVHHVDHSSPLGHRAVMLNAVSAFNNATRLVSSFYSAARLVVEKLTVRIGEQIFSNLRSNFHA